MSPSISAAATARAKPRRASASTAISTSCETTQRYRFYRALQHPLYPILRKVERIAEHVEHARKRPRGAAAWSMSRITRATSTIWSSRWCSTTTAIRPPLIAAGINLFGGALGLLHRHVTGAIPIRRNSKDPPYLVTLRAYVAEC